MTDDAVQNPGTLIFVLDDEPGAVKMMRDALRTNMAATVKAFVRFEDMAADPDLVDVDLFVLDINLGDLSGFDVPDRLPTRCLFAAFLFVSGFPVDMEQYDRAGGLAFFDFLGKPFPMVHFVHRVNLLLAARLKLPVDLDDNVLNIWARSPFVAVVLDADFKVFLCNRQTADLLEVGSSRDLVGRSWADFLPEETVQTARGIHGTVLNGDLSRAGEISGSVRSAKGKVHRIRWFNSPFEGPENEVLTLSIGIPWEYKARMATRLRTTWKESILKHRAAIRAIKRLPLKTDFPETCQLNGNGGPNDA